MAADAIEPVQIPWQLKDHNAFTAVYENSKRPIGEQWNINWRTFSDSLFQQHLREGKPVGVGLVDGLAVIDADELNFGNYVLSTLPKSWVVDTPREPGKTFHYYLKIKNIPDDIGNYIALKDSNGNPVGELRIRNCQVLMAGSPHPNGGMYKTRIDEPMAEFEWEEIARLLSDYIPKPVLDTYERVYNTDLDIDLKMKDILSTMNTSDFVYVKDGIQGPHPVHGSISGINTHINVNENIGFCFRDSFGFNALQLYAMIRGFIKCGERLRGEQFKLAIESAKREFPHLVKQPTLGEDLEPLNFLWDGDLRNRVIERPKFVIDGFLPRKGLNVLGAKRGVGKTWLSLLMGITIASGRILFDRLQTEKMNVLYIDEENSESEMINRLNMVKKGLGIEDNVPIGIRSLLGFKFDDPVQLRKLRSALKKYSPCVLIIDSFKRTVSVEEDKADSIGKIYTNILVPMLREYDVTILLIHHLRKGNNMRRPDDLLDELRGSSEVANVADSVLIMESDKSSGRINLRHEKSRRAKPQDPLSIEFVFTEDSVSIVPVGSPMRQLNADEKCRDIILEAIKNLDEFETHQMKQACIGSGFSEASAKRAIEMLESSQKIERIKKGLYRKTTTAQTAQSI